MNLHYVFLLPISVHVILSIRYTVLCVLHRLLLPPPTIFYNTIHHQWGQFPRPKHLVLTINTFSQISREQLLFISTDPFIISCQVSSSTVIQFLLTLYILCACFCHASVIEGGQIACSSFEFGFAYWGPHCAPQKWLLHRKALTIISCSFHPIFFCRTRLSKKDSATTPATTQGAAHGAMQWRATLWKKTTAVVTCRNSCPQIIEI